MSIATVPDVASLLAENARLRAIVDRVRVLADNATTQWSEPPGNGTLALVTTSGGWQTQPEIEHAFIRADRNEQQLNDASMTAEWADGAWWPVGSGKPTDGEHPRTWGELNWWDDPDCDRGSVSMETFVSVDDLNAALVDDSAVAA